LGTDALGMSRDELAELLKNRRGSLKGALMNQKLMAGLGNVYADEVLFRTGLHPKKGAGGVEDEEADELHRNLRFVLKAAIQGRVEEFPSDFLIPRREEGAQCPRCGGMIRKTRVSGRPTYFCQDHQKRRS
jgi:formamidopyrimidine-DNA glycosylase